MAVDPPGEYREQQLKRLKRLGHCSEVYRLTNHRASSSGRLAHSPIASFEFFFGHYGLIRAKHPFQLLSKPICSGGAGEGALPIRSYSAITWAPNISKVDASSKLSKTTMAVVSDP